MLSPYGHSIDVHGNWHNYFRFVVRVSTMTPVNNTSLHSLPLGAAILKPYFYLHFAELEVVRNLRTLGQRKVLLAVKFFLQFQELFAREGRPSTSGFVGGPTAADKVVCFAT